MSDINQSSIDQEISSEIRTLAENMLLELEQGHPENAVALVHDLNQVREETLYREIGKLTRALHEAIKNLKVSPQGEEVESGMNGTMDKLTYVLHMTDRSANRTMDLVDEGMPLVTDIHDRAEELSGRWKKLLQKDLKPDEFRSLTKDIDQYLEENITKTEQIKNEFSEILLAQDFQDLTGQVIHKVIDLVRDVEKRLVSLVAMAGHVDRITGIQHNHAEDVLDEDHKIRAEGPHTGKDKTDVVSSQDDVDDLLSSLGF